jgi:hypothetical protein
MLAMYGVSLSRPAYNPKFLLLATPGFLILVARGVSVLYPGLFLRERAPYTAVTDPIPTRLARQYIGIGKLLVGGLFAAGIVLALQNLYGDPRLRRDDYRGIVNYINALATERDTVIVNAPGQLDVVRYYYRGNARLITLPVGRPLLPGPTREEIFKALENSQRLFAIYWATEQADPERLVERALSETSFSASDVWHGNVRLAEYAVAGEQLETQVDARFGDSLTLERYSTSAQPLGGGDILTLNLVWSALRAPQTNYKVFVHLLDAHGHIIAQHDSEPGNGFAPMTHWQAGRPVSDRIGVVIPPGTPPGEYSLVMGVYRGDTGERLSTGDDADTLSLGAVTVVKRLVPRAALLLTSQAAAEAGPLQVLGLSIERSNFARGEFIPLVLYFQAREKPPADVVLYVQLLDQGDNIISSARAFESYPATRWDAGEIVRDVQSLAVPVDALPGEYKIVVRDGSGAVDLRRVYVR